MPQRKNRRKRRGAKRRAAPGRQQFPRSTMRVQRNPMQRIGPDELDITLTYPLIVAGGSGTNQYQARWNPNAAYDVDPTLGSTSTPGFSEEAALYSHYRVVSSFVNFTFTNKSTSAGMVYVTWSNGDPGTTASNVFPSNPNTISRGFAPLGTTGAQKKIHSRMNFASLLGQNVIDTSQDFQAAVNAVPTDLFWVAIGAFPNSGNFSANVEIYGLITMHIRFFSRKYNLTAFQNVETQRKLCTDWLLRQIQKAKALVLKSSSEMTATDVGYLNKAKALLQLSPDDDHFLEKGMLWFKFANQHEL